MNHVFESLECPAESSASMYSMILMLAGLSMASYTVARVAEAHNQLNFADRSTRIISGFLMLTMRLMHTPANDLEIINTDSKIITAGPHRTGLDAMVLASKMKGTPPQFFATDMFNAIPGVAAIMKKFKVIPIAAKAVKGDKIQSANSGALEKASQALQEHGCVALFPQGGFSKIGEEPRRVYGGAAQLALTNQLPLHVIRLDGFWSLQNPLIPLVVRNSTYYRAFFAGLHMNNVRATECAVIDFHLKPENQHLSKDEKIEAICAELYAYYRQTEDLSAEEIADIKTDVTSNKHLLFWKDKVEHDANQKALESLKKEESVVARCAR